ncbi:hypothetical protein P775_06505 [Puniceibacterium antarcticum]|uniref:Uncharacterized protein n=1 Tax=Puniceibacterium antarcticum TaxID=1206336 RepID=A0A2G8RHF4_9RHOB|nr:hypothetical protein P775_06505 [Puniceibacterium antarcticum]
MNRAGFVGWSAANLDLALAGLGVQGQQGAALQDLDPAARVRRVVLVHIQAYDF